MREWFGSGTPAGVAIVIFLGIMACIGLAPIVYIVLVLIIVSFR